MVQVWVQTFRKASEAVRFTHAGSCSKDTDTSGIFEIIQSVSHFLKISGKIRVFLGNGFIKRVKGKGIKIVIHQIYLQALSSLS